MWVADNDLLKQTEIEKRPLLEFWFLLNNKVIDAEKQIAKNKPSTNMRRGRTNTD